MPYTPLRRRRRPLREYSRPDSGLGPKGVSIKGPFHRLRGPPPHRWGEASGRQGRVHPPERSDAPFYSTCLRKQAITCGDSRAPLKKAAAWPLLFSVFQCTNDFIDVFYVILIAPFFHFVHDAFHGGGVSQVGGAYLDSIRAGYHEFDGVFAGHNAA